MDMTPSIEPRSDLIATDDGWPEAEGDECDRRRPGLVALIAQCRTWIADHPDAIKRAIESHDEYLRLQAERTRDTKSDTESPGVAPDEPALSAEVGR